MSCLDNGCCLRQLVCAFDARVGNFIASYAGKAPAGLVLDRNPTACIVHGQQERSMLSTHVAGLYETGSARLGHADTAPPCPN